MLSILALAITAGVIILLSLSWIDNAQVKGKTTASHHIRLTSNYELKERQTTHHRYYSVIADHHEMETLIHEQISQAAELKDGYVFKNKEDFFGYFPHDNYFFVPKKGTQIDFYSHEQDLTKTHGTVKWKNIQDFKPEA